MWVFCAARVKLNSSKTAITDSICFVLLRAIVLLLVPLDGVWIGGTIWSVCAFVHFRGALKITLGEQYSWDQRQTISSSSCRFSWRRRLSPRNMPPYLDATA